MLKIDDFDDAVIGPASVWREEGLVDVLIYDGEKMVEVLMREGSTEEEARDYISFNCEGWFLGPTTPIIVWPNPNWKDDLDQDQ